MARSITVAVRLALGSLAIGLAGLLAGYLPSLSPSSVFADATFTVNSTGDEADTAPGDGVCAVASSGLCTLRAAVEEANALAGSDTIQFNLPSEGGYVISPSSALPEIVGSLVIDGTTQAGYSGQPLVELDGTSAGQASGLSVNTSRGSTSTISGLVIHDFAVFGLAGGGEGKTVIHGNVIASNGGPDPHGRRGGIYLGDGVTIGGTSPGAANVIAHNRGHGVVHGYFSGGTISGNSIYDNAGQGIFFESRCFAVGPCGTYPDHIPAITSVERVGDNIVVRGLNNPNPGRFSPSNATLEFFANRTIDPSGYGEGEIFLGAREMYDITFEETFPAPAVGCIITATGLTAMLGDTSSFSRGVMIGRASGVGGGLLIHNSIHSNGAEGLVMYSDPDYPTSSVVQSASRSRGELTINGSARSVPEADLETPYHQREVSASYRERPRRHRRNDAAGIQRKAAHRAGRFSRRTRNRSPSTRRPLGGKGPCH